MKSFGLHIAFFVLFSGLLSAQEDGVVSFSIPVRNSLTFNRFVLNPTFSIVREENRILSFTNKREWVQFDNAPETYVFSYSGRLNERSGFGIGLYQQNYGVLTSYGGILNYAYNVPLGYEQNLSFGANLAVYQSSINTGNVISNFSDPSLNNVPSNFLMTFNPAINYGTRFLDFGVILNNYTLYNFTTSKLVEDDPEKYIEAYAMYTGFMNSTGFFDDSKFTALVGSEFREDNLVINGLMMLTVPKGIWGQLGYSTLNGFSVGLGLNIYKGIAIEYNYEKRIGDLVDFGSAHEITLAYRFKQKSSYAFSNDQELGSLIPERRPVRSYKKADEATKARIAARAEARRRALSGENITPSTKPAAVKEPVDTKPQEEKVMASAEPKRMPTSNRTNPKATTTVVPLNKTVAIRTSDGGTVESRNIETATNEAEAVIKARAEAEALAKLKAKQQEEEEAKRLAALKAEEEKRRQAAIAAQAAAEEEELKQKEEAARLEAQRLAEQEAKLKAQQEAEEARQKALEEEKQKALREAEEAKRLAELKANEEKRRKAAMAALAAAEAEEKKESTVATNTDVSEVETETSSKSKSIVANDKNSVAMQSLTEESNKAREDQENLIKDLQKTVDSRRQDLKDMRKENDLSEQGIYSAPKPFKSISEENAKLKSLTVNLDKTINEQEERIEELKKLYKKRKQQFPSDDDEMNMIYLDEILILQKSQKRTKEVKKTLMLELSQIKMETDVERKRRIKRAAYDSQEDRYAKDMEDLKRLKASSIERNDELGLSDFDFGESKGGTIKILKDVKNAKSGYYLVMAVHSGKQKRDEFVKSALAAGISDINFFYDVNTSKYYIYSENYSSLSEANKALAVKGSKVYESNISMIRIENK